MWPMVRTKHERAHKIQKYAHQFFWELKNVDFWAVTRQAAFFQKGIAPLIFIRSGSTKSQINRLDEHF